MIQWSDIEEAVNRIQIPALKNIAAYDAQRAGKKIRARLIFEVARACGTLQENHIRLAQTVEAFHTASLFHDDVLDGEHTRRGKDCVHRVWGNKYAILAGDSMFVEGLRHMHAIKNWDLCVRTQEMVQETLNGQMNEYTVHAHTSLEDYVHHVISKKTGSFFMLACEGAAMLAGASAATQKQLHTYGKYMGIAYQIHDDVQEYMIPCTQWNQGHDFVQEKYTYPLFLARDAGYTFEHIHTPENYRHIQGHMTPFLTITQQHAEAYQQKGREALKEIKSDFLCTSFEENMAPFFAF